MEILILTKKDLQQLYSSITAIQKTLRSLTEIKFKDEILTNKQFIQLLEISKGTAQRWRDEGKIRFSKIDSKIYYKRKDILDFLEHHACHAFNKGIL